MATATLVRERLSRFCPTTNHYACDDGSYLLVTIPTLDFIGTLEGLGIELPVSEYQLPNYADVFLADDEGVPIDSDGDPANGMTPLLRVPDCDDFATALAAAGYDLVEAD